MSSCSDSDIIGEEAEREYEEEKVPEVKKSTPKKQRLSMSERLRLIDQYRQGKTDKFYSVAPLKNKPGEFRITKRKKPLDLPIPDSEPMPEKIVKEPIIDMSPVKEEPVKEKSDKNKEFYAMQTTINNSLSKEIAAVMEKCNKIERKLKKQKEEKRAKKQAKRQAEVEEYDYDNEPEYQEEPREQVYMPQHSYYSPFNVRHRIDLTQI